MTDRSVIRPAKEMGFGAGMCSREASRHLQAEPGSACPDAGAERHYRAISIVDHLLGNRSEQLEILTEPFRGIDLLDVLLTVLYLEFLEPPSVPKGPLSTIFASARLAAFKLRQRMHERAIDRLKTPVEARPICFWPVDITHITAQLPVAAKLPPDSSAFITSSAKVFHQLQAAGVHRPISTTVWRDLHRQAGREARRRVRRCSLPSKGCNPYSESDIEIRSVRTVTMHLQQALKSILDAERTIELMQPEAMVIGNDLTLDGRAATLVAKQHSIPTVVLAHGTVLEHSTHGYHVATRVTAYGTAHEQTYLKLGSPKDQIVVTGAPELDNRATQGGETHPALIARFGLTPAFPWVLVATSGAGHIISERQQAETISALIQACEELPEVRFVVRLHKKDHPRNYARLPKHLEHRFQIVRNQTPGLPISIYDWLQGCSAVLTGASTVAIEGMLMEVPVITMDFTNELSAISFIAADATMHVTQRNDLSSAIRQVAIEKKWPNGRAQRASEIVTTELGELNGNASQRVACLIENLRQNSWATSDPLK